MENVINQTRKFTTSKLTSKLLCLLKIKIDLISFTLHFILEQTYNLINQKIMIQEFVFGDSSPKEKEDNRPTYCDLLADDLYVAQFLNVNDLNLNDSQELEEEIIVQEYLPEEQKEKVQEELVQIEKTHKKRSSFHNFQKHLVTTIRSIIDSSKFGKDFETSLCEKKIWKIFMNSNKINKTLVTMVVGDLTLEPSSKIFQYGFKEIIRQFEPEIVKQAQLNINQQIFRQLKGANLVQELSNRRMRNKKQFVIYFQAFLQELVKGELEKRMAKCTKLLKNQIF